MLSLGIDTIKDFVEFIALIVGVIAVVWGVLTYRVTQRQFNFSVMISCIERFQEILPQLSSSDPEEKLLAIRRYVDLCNEELFYFKNGYIPDEVIDEWIEGMAFYLPWFDASGKNLNPKTFPEIINQNLLTGYPRIRYTFTLTRYYDLDIPNEKYKLIDSVKQNLKGNHNEVG